MSDNFQGDVGVVRSLTTGRRANQGAQTKALIGTEVFDLHQQFWNNFTVAAPQDVTLPDATTLTLGWSVVVNNQDITNAIAVKDAAAGAVKSIIAGRCYQFTCTSIGSTAGTWKIQFIDESDLIPADRYSTTFDATTSWGAPAGGYYTITVTAATHLLGTIVKPTLYIVDGSDYDEIHADQCKVLANGDVKFRVTQTPDGRFAGRIEIL